jgi:hypothetical protein
MTDWEKFLERRSKNIGFISKLNAFREPTSLEKAEALEIETKRWQETIGKRPFHLGTEYSISRGYEYDINNPDNFVKKDAAIKAYVNTPMDPNGILASQEIDVERYKWRKIGILKAIFYKIIGRKVRRIYDKQS